MKKFAKKLTLAIVLVLACVLSLAMVVACTDNGGQEHEHDYSVWNHDAQSHWRVCAEDKDIEEGSASKHIDEDENGVCDVCGYDGMHVHSYDAYDHDENSHWAVCSCGARENVEGDEHVDEDENGVCDVCEYDGMHVHNYVWSYDEDNHWHYCLGCQDVEDGSESAHVDEDMDFVCDECEYHLEYFIVKIKDDKGNVFKGIELQIGESEVATDANGIAKFKMLPPDGMDIWVSNLPDSAILDESKSYVTATDKYIYEIVLSSEITTTFTVQDYADSEPMSGVTLKLLDGTAVIASGVTDSDGVVTITYPVGASGEKYYFAIDDLKEDQYLSKSAGVSKRTSGYPITVNVYTYKYETYAITVACDDGVEYEVKGLTVELWKTVSYGRTECVASAEITEESGVVSIRAIKADSYLYTVKISGLADGYKVSDGSVGFDWWEGSNVTSATLTIEKTAEEGGSQGGEQGGEQESTDTWYTSFGNEIVIAEDNITFDGEDVIELSSSESDDGKVEYTFYVGMQSYLLYQSGEDWYLDDNWNPVEKLLKVKPVLLDYIPEAFKGTWNGSYEDGGDVFEYEYIINAEGVTLDEFTNTFENGCLIVMSETKIYLDGGTYLYYNANGTITLDVYGDGSFEVTLTKATSKAE